MKKKKQGGKEKKTVVHTEKVEDFAELSGARLQFRISRVQQEALDKATGHVPHPLQQLELMNKKKEKGPKAYHAGKKKYRYFWFCVYVGIDVMKKSENTKLLLLSSEISKPLGEKTEAVCGCQ